MSAESPVTPPAPFSETEAFQPEAEPFEYRLLVGHHRTDGSFKSTEALQQEYVHLTDKLVNKITNGVEVRDPETGEMVHSKPDHVVFLDKSARPVAWLLRELWPTLAAEADGSVPPMPKINFVNIDREQWVNTVDPTGAGEVDIKRVDRGIIRGLRSLFVSPIKKVEEEQKGNGLGDYIDDESTLLDDTTILIVDEVYSTGRTLRIAKDFFGEAFPTAKIASMHWMGGLTARGTAVGNADLPVWYSSDEITGRGIGDRSPYKSAMSSSVTQRLGGWFLSTALKGDEKGKRLRQEIKQLAEDVRQHSVLVLPDVHREEADLDERIERLNGMSVAEFIAQRNKTRKK